MRLLLQGSPSLQARQLKELPHSQTWEGGDGTGLVLPRVENPAATTCSYSLGIQGPVCSREKVVQWEESGKRGKEKCVG